MSEEKAPAPKRVLGLTIDGDLFKVLINDEGQHSIWPADKAEPEGWRVIGSTGTKAECSAFVDKNWTDMRPLSLQRSMEKGRAKE